MASASPDNISGDRPETTRRETTAQKLMCFRWRRIVHRMTAVMNYQTAMNRSASKSIATAVLAVVLASPAAAVSTITGVGVVPGKANSTAYGVSNDGQVVVGVSADSRNLSQQAFKWTPTDGITGLGLLPGSAYNSARAVSKDGTTVVGFMAVTPSIPFGPDIQGFRYQGGVMAGLPTMAQSFAVNADGSIVVGYGNNQQPNYSFGISNDGSVVVGRSGGFKAQRWTAATGAVNLGDTGSVANAVSGNGLVSVGNRFNVACYWTESGGFVSIGTPGVISTALAVNFDGSIIVGRANSGPNGGTEAFVWTPTDGMRGLASILTAQGVDLDPWQYQRHPALVEATGISDDGQFLVGNGVRQAFIVQLQLNPIFSAIEQWRLTNFGRTADAGSFADVADPDNDGLPNLLEYALGSNPLRASPTSAPAGSVVDSHLVLTFARIADPALAYSVEAATTLTAPGWLSLWSSTGAANTAGPVSVADMVSLSAQTSRYLRLKVSR